MKLLCSISFITPKKLILLQYAGSRFVPFSFSSSSFAGHDSWTVVTCCFSCVYCGTETWRNFCYILHSYRCCCVVVVILGCNRNAHESLDVQDFSLLWLPVSLSLFWLGMGWRVVGEVVSDIRKHNSPFISLGSSSKIWLLYREGEGTTICHSFGNHSTDDAVSHPCRLESPLLCKIALIFKTVCYLPESIMIAVLWCITGLLSRCYWNLMWYLYFWWKPQSHTPQLSTTNNEAEIAQNCMNATSVTVEDQ